MSQLRQKLPNNVSAPFLHPNRWNAFVKVVVEMTIEAYQLLRKDCIAENRWEEDIFTVNLVDYLQRIAKAYPMNIIVKAQTMVFTTQMKRGAVSPKSAARIDIQLWGGHWDNYEQIYFAWECKLILEKPLLKKHNRLIPEYISKGIMRFIDEKYSKDVKNAGMLGYVLMGAVPSIVKNINDAMLLPKKSTKPNSSITSSQRLTEADHLAPCPPIRGFNDIYISNHQRKLCLESIQLHHLFLTFDF